MSGHYAQAHELVNEALQELAPQPDEQQRSFSAAQVHATLALVDILAEWIRDVRSEPLPAPPDLTLCLTRSPVDGYACSLPQGHRGEHIATVQHWANEGAP